MRRRAVLLLLAVLTLPGGAGAVVGGTTIGVDEAPWSTLLTIAVPGGVVGHCSAVIVDPVHVVTAGHCVDLGPGGRVPPSALTVQAGSSDGRTLPASGTEQDRDVTRIRIHPGFVWTLAGSADDVAVLELSEPLDLTGPAVRSVATAQDVQPAVRSPFRFAGFGLTRPGGRLDLTLHAMTGSVGRCGNPAAAVYFCATSPSGAVCAGDSGGGLVSTTTTPILLGIATAASCLPGTIGWFANAGAPEIARFIEGDDDPPMAPREVESPSLRPAGRPRVRERLGCLPGRWSGSPTFAYSFVDERGRVLQTSRSSWYRVRPADASHRIACRVAAANAGGTGTGETRSTPVVRSTVAAAGR